MILFGIVGKKFSGKSSAASFFRKKFIPIVDLDEMYRPIFQPGNKGHRILINSLGEEVVSNNGNIDMLKLSFLICNEIWIRELVDDVLYEEFNSIVNKLRNAFKTHNIIVGGIESYIGGSERMIDNFDFTILIDSDDEDRRKRMRSIGVPEIVIDKVINNEQIYDKVKSRYILNNRHTFIDFEKACFGLIEDIKSEYLNGYRWVRERQKK